MTTSDLTTAAPIGSGRHKSQPLGEINYMSTFSIKIFQNGYKIVTTDFTENLPIAVSHFTSLLPNVSEVDWYIDIIKREAKIGERISVSYNSVCCYINQEITEIGFFDENNIEILEEMLTSDLITFLEELKALYQKYEAGGIPGVIPESKMDKWSIVPNEYFKDEWWEFQKQKESGA